MLTMCDINIVKHGQGQIDLMTMSDHETWLEEAFCDLK